MILTANESSNPLGLWKAFKEYMAEDLNRARLANPTDTDVDMDAVYNQALIVLEDEVININGNSLSFTIPCSQ